MHRSDIIVHRSDIFVYISDMIVHRSDIFVHRTASGVKHLKEERHKEAKKCFDQALDVDPENVEALVARGAQYVNIVQHWSTG